MSSSTDSLGLRAYLQSSFEVLRRECPVAFRRVCRRLAPRTIALEVDGETALLAFRPESVDFVPALELPDLRISTTTQAILSVLSARSTLWEAVRADAIVLKGSTEDLARFHDGLLDYVRGAIRCPSFPGRDDYQSLRARAGPGPRTRKADHNAAFLHREIGTAPVATGQLILLDPAARPGGRLTVAQLIDLLHPRLELLPGLRQRLAVPPEAARPVWVRDAVFDLRYHVRPAVLPAPGGSRELVELVEQIYGNPLDRTRPLWELYVVEGLADGRTVLVMRWHASIAGRAGGIALSQAVFDGAGLRPAERGPSPPGPAPPEPDMLRDLDQPPSRPGLDRRFSMAELPWTSVRALARAAGCSAGDVLLAPLASALGRLLERQDPEGRDRVQRVLSTIAGRQAGERSGLADACPLRVVDLPVGPMDEADRLVRVAAATRAAPAPDLDACLDHVNLAVWSSGGRQPTLASAAGRSIASYPIPPISERLALTVAFARLDGSVGVGMMADRVAVPDLGLVANDLRAAFATLEQAMPWASGA